MRDKPLIWLHTEIKTPPVSSAARVKIGALLRRLQRGENLSMPHSRPMPIVGKRCHELRVEEKNKTWRVVYRADSDAVVVLHNFAKKTGATPQREIKLCRRRLRHYEDRARTQGG